ncbi:DUF983 domain-containing protein [Frigidibacter sp. MR17.14]|uniref:DUF983 domain-containing protein n=1 Tax=Frigidibacter sp. MR17.14 TaxID=3126509 RepID=UPI0030131B1D
MTDCTPDPVGLRRTAAAPPPRDGAAAERPLGPALRRGWRRRCPRCGSGPMFSGYLKVRDACPVCGLDLHHHRADDGPAYLTILIVGHILAPVLLGVYTAFRPEPLVMASGLAVGTVALSLWLLPRLKGGLVALQWAKRMHGFGHPSQDDPDHSQ